VSRTRLNVKYLESGEISNPEMLEISEEIDRLLNEYQKEKARSN
jgi:hypothetical protein